MTRRPLLVKFRLGSGPGAPSHSRSESRPGPVLRRLLRPIKNSPLQSGFSSAPAFRVMITVSPGLTRTGPPHQRVGPGPGPDPISAHPYMAVAVRVSEAHIEATGPVTPRHQTCKSIRVIRVPGSDSAPGPSPNRLPRGGGRRGSRPQAWSRPSYLLRGRASESAAVGPSESAP